MFFLEFVFIFIWIAIIPVMTALAIWEIIRSKKRKKYDLQKIADNTQTIVKPKMPHKKHPLKTYEKKSVKMIIKGLNLNTPKFYKLR